MSVIQALWIGDRLSPLESLSIGSFLAHGHEYHLYTYRNVLHVPDGAKVKDGREILPEGEIFCYQTGPGKGSVSAFSNLFRYKLLHDRGGIWADTDVICLKPFDFSGGYVFGRERCQWGTFVVASCVLSAPPGSAFAAYCLRRFAEHDRTRLAWGATGPRLVTEAVRHFALEPSVLPAEAFCPADWWAVDRQVVGPGGRAVDLGGSYAVHLWHEMWRRNGFDKNARHHPDSLYSILSAMCGPERGEPGA